MFNSLQAAGDVAENSEVREPTYQFPDEASHRSKYFLEPQNELRYS